MREREAAVSPRDNDVTSGNALTDDVRADPTVDTTQDRDILVSYLTFMERRHGVDHRDFTQQLWNQHPISLESGIPLPILTIFDLLRLT